MRLYERCRCGKHKIWFFASWPYRVPYLREYLIKRRERKFFDRVMGPAIEALRKRIDELNKRQ